MVFIPKPEPGEYAPYAIQYINLLPDETDIISYLEEGMLAVLQVFRTLADEKTTSPFAEGEWTVKEILCHIMDQERVFVYRALRFARHDSTEVSPFDHDAYVLHSGANQRALHDLVEEYISIRRSTLAFFRSLPQDALALSGKVGGINASVRALAWLTAGHELHHLNSIRENYL